MPQVFVGKLIQNVLIMKKLKKKKFIFFFSRGIYSVYINTVLVLWSLYWHINILLNKAIYSAG